MNDVLDPRRKTAAKGPVMVFEPVRVRSGMAWRCWTAARTALLVWGGVSLAGAIGGGVYMLQGPGAPEDDAVMAVVAQADPTQADPAQADPIVTGSIAPDRQLAEPSPTAPLGRQAVRQILPSPAASGMLQSPRGEAMPVTAASAAVARAENFKAQSRPVPADATGPSAQDRAQGPTSLGALALADRLDRPDDETAAAADLEIAALETSDRDEIARVPRARPEPPVSVARMNDEIDEMYEPQTLYRFRRLHEIPRRFRPSDPDVAWTPYPVQRRRGDYYYYYRR